MQHCNEFLLEQILDYEQPSKYIVRSTAYNDSYDIPVLTPGKSFILGYTNEKDGIYNAGKDYPVIIFDDFTTDIKFVDFPFKVKSSAMKILIPNVRIANPKYLFYLMQTIHCEHGTHKRYWLQHYSKIKVSVPSLSEQQRIVAKIEELFAELDNSVAMLKKVKEQLEVYRQAVIDSVFENISENKKIADICEYVTDGDHLPPPKTDTGIPFIMISNVNGNRICWDKTAFVSNEYYKNISFQRKPKKGDVLYTVTGSFGIPILVDFEKKFCFQRHIALLSPKNIVKQKFLYYALQTTGVYMQAVAKATGTAQKTVSLSVLRNMTIPFFDELNVQTNIIDRLDKQLQDCEFMSLNVNNSLQQADALRQSILKKAFGGEL